MDTQQQIDEQINSLQQCIQCNVCNDRDRNTLLILYKHFIACREYTLRFYNECPVCHAAVTQIICFMSKTAIFFKNSNKWTKLARKIFVLHDKT